MILLRAHCARENDVLKQSVWQALSDGDFEEAIELADQEHSRTGSIFPLRNKVFALLHLHRYHEVTELCKSIMRSTNNESDSDAIFCGVGYWLIGRESEAIEVWKLGYKSPYTDAAGGVDIPLLLFYSGTRIGSRDLIESSRGYLRKTSHRGRQTDWPRPVADYVLGRMDKDGLLGSMDNNSSLRAKQKCQADFYIGVMAFLKGEEQAALEAMKSCVSTSSSSFTRHEYYLAYGEVCNAACRIPGASSDDSDDL